MCPEQHRIPLIERTEQLDRLPMRLSRIRTKSSTKFTRACRTTARFSALPLLAVVFFSGCTVGPKYHRPAAPVGAIAIGIDAGLPNRVVFIERPDTSTRAR